MPLQELWNSNGAIQARKRRDLTEMEIKAVLQTGPVQFIVAELGKPLRWVAKNDCFSFWHKEVKPHLVDPKLEGFYLEGIPGGYAYCASEWCVDTGLCFLLLEMHH